MYVYTCVCSSNSNILTCNSTITAHKYVAYIIYFMHIILCIHIYTWLSSPRVNSMKKNNRAQSVATGICDIPSGYATNASPGPATQYKLYSDFIGSTIVAI